MMEINDATIDKGIRVVSPSIALAETPAVGAHPTFSVVEAAQGRAVIGFGDGSLRALSLSLQGLTPAKITGLDAVPLTGALDLGGTGVLVGTDAGSVLRVEGNAVATLVSGETEWVNALAVHQEKGLRAFAAGRHAVVLDGNGNTVLRATDHASTVAALAFSADGDWLAAAHYGGVNVWPLAAPGKSPVALEWHGSHTAVSWSPDGKFIVTAMQDKEMHCWRWKDRKSMRMSGYPSKIRALSWTADSRFVAASGADTVTSWDCSGGGPGGKAPLEFGYAYNGTVRQVAAHPSRHLVAGGYSDGTVLIGEIEQETAMIARPASGAPIAALGWTPDGTALVAVDDLGATALMRLKDAMV